MINWIEKLGCYVKILSVLNKKKCIGLKEVTRLGFSKETTTPPTFISVQMGEREKNNIISLEKDGQVIEGDDKLLEHATEYYSELFGTPIEYEVQMDPLSGRMLQKSLQMITASYVGLLRKLKSKKLCGKWIQ